MEKSLCLPFDIDIDLVTLTTMIHPSELRMEMESAIEDAVETAEDILVQMQMLEPERMMGQYCQSINETATEGAKSVKNGVLNIFSKILTNNEDEGGNDNGGAVYEGQNPLMIDLVLRTVMQYLNNETLAICRLVCKLWNLEGGAKIRKKQRIVFSPNCIERMKDFTSLMKLQMEEEWEEMVDKSLLPTYSDFSFTAQFPQINFSKKVVGEFSQFYGRFVKKLEIFFPNDSALSAKDFRKVFLEGMPQLEWIHFVNLPMKLTQKGFLTERRRNVSSRKTVKEINWNNNLLKKDIFNEDNNKIELENDEEEAFLEGMEENSMVKWEYLRHLKIDRTLLMETGWSTEFLKDLLKTMPNLRHYELWTWNTMTGEGDGKSNPYFNCLTETQRNQLISLYPGSVGEGILKSLKDFGLNSLRKLHLPVFSGEVSAQSVEGLLGGLKGTLEELQLNCSSMEDSRMIRFPKMEKLKSLHMIISVPWKNVYTLFTPSIQYQNEFPVLESFKLELAVYHDFGFIHYFFPGAGSVCRTLKELDITFSGYRDEKFIGIVAKLFPNLITLRLDGYGNRILAGICLYLQNLEYFEMYLIYGFNVDDQLTGIDRKVCNEIRKKCGGGGGNKYLDFKMEGEIQVLPSLANLSKLKTLKIKQKDYQAKYWPQAQCITDVTGYFALAKIKSLRHLHIESVKFSPECRQYLATTLEDCWLDFL